MYLDGFSFLEEERDAWRPFEALLELSDEQLGEPVAAAHAWSGRDLMAHLCVWQEWALQMAKELAVGTTSATWDRLQAFDWDSEGDEMNARQLEEWRVLPMAEVRRRFAAVPGELRGYLTVVPETRWLKDGARFKTIEANTLGHYAEHEADLRAVLAAAGPAGGSE